MAFLDRAARLGVVFLLLIGYLGLVLCGIGGELLPMVLLLRLRFGNGQIRVRLCSLLRLYLFLTGLQFLRFLAVLEGSFLSPCLALACEAR